MPLRKNIAAGLALVWSLCAPAAGFAQERIVPRAQLDSLADPPTAAGSRVMRFEQRQIDIGTLNEDDAPAQYRFRWHNDSDTPLVVTRVQTTCGCVAASCDRQPVGQGASGTVAVTFYPKRHPGPFRRKVFVFTQLSDRLPTAVLELTGEVTPSVLPTHDYPYVRGPLRLKQQEVRIGGERRQVERIECLNAGTEPLRIEADSRLLPPYVTLECDPATIDPGQSADLIVRFDPAQAAGPLPQRLPLLLEGIQLPPSQRTISIRFGSDATNK